MNSRVDATCSAAFKAIFLVFLEAVSGSSASDGGLLLWKTSEKEAVFLKGS